jgi:hypothetical protein
MLNVNNDLAEVKSTQRGCRWTTPPFRTAAARAPTNASVAKVTHRVEKSERANVSANELESLQTQASELLALSGAQLKVSVDDGALQEICHDC